MESWLPFCGFVVLAAPALLVAVLGLTTLSNRPLGEAIISRWTQATVLTGLTAAITILVTMLATGLRRVPIEVGNWVVIPEQHFHFHLKFIFDRLSVPFVILSYVLCGTVAAFASKYLHRERGFLRFFILYALFFFGMVLSTLAATIESLFMGWELVGLSSALLVAYFWERPNPVRNGLRVWSVYRFADAAFLVAAVALHHLTGEGDFSNMMGANPWPQGDASLNITSGQALFVGLLLLVAAAGKSGLIPFSGWLPRAMEGPTPSSAVFYGALSVHLGAFLLLRASPIFEASPIARAAMITLGGITAVYSALTARVQIDAKSALAFASLTQVSVIVVEIGLGFYYLALIHIIGHACLRTLQLLRAPTLLRDYQHLENAIGSHLTHREGRFSSWIPGDVRAWFYRLAFERGYLDASIDAWILTPFVRLFRWCDRAERRWTDFLSGSASRESDQVAPNADAAEGLR